MMIDYILMALLSFGSPYGLTTQIKQNSKTSGYDFCRRSPDLLLRENGHFVEVPLDHKSPTKGSIKLYYRTETPFNPKLPSVVVFNGGPGLGAHQDFLKNTTEYNIILFDPRGVGCSRWSSNKNPSSFPFLNSESIAQDIEFIRRDLKIAKWTVWGLSYGSAPATIYAHLYPERTQALLLEGVIRSGGSHLWSNSRRREMQEQVLRRLTVPELNVVTGLAAKLKIDPTWFGVKSRQYLSANGGAEIFIHYLRSLNSPSVQRQLKKEMLKVRTSQAFYYLYKEEQVFAQIGCRELGLAVAESSDLEALSQTGLIYEMPGSAQQRYCSTLGVIENNPYNAYNYPIRVPTYYFHGRDDVILPFEEAERHFNEVARGRAYLLIHDKGGHTPHLQLLREGNRQQWSVFKQITRGVSLSAEQFSKSPWIFNTK
ncbi:MAG: alpha/beta fold hydrolase [Bdellovibrionia bacterium]